MKEEFTLDIKDFDPNKMMKRIIMHDFDLSSQQFDSMIKVIVDYQSGFDLGKGTSLGVDED